MTTRRHVANALSLPSPNDSNGSSASGSGSGSAPTSARLGLGDEKRTSSIMTSNGLSASPLTSPLYGARQQQSTGLAWPSPQHQKNNNNLSSPTSPSATSPSVSGAYLVTVDGAETKRTTSNGGTSAAATTGSNGGTSLLVPMAMSRKSSDTMGSTTLRITTNRTSSMMGPLSPRGNGNGNGGSSGGVMSGPSSPMGTMYSPNGGAPIDRNSTMTSTFGKALGRTPVHTVNGKVINGGANGNDEDEPVVWYRRLFWCCCGRVITLRDLRLTPVNVTDQSTIDYELARVVMETTGGGFTTEEMDCLVKRFYRAGT
jgi:hypothetical protein